MFRTKSTLGKQNSFKLPLREESAVVPFQKNDNEGVGFLDDSVNESVPAGRYFAALNLIKSRILKTYFCLKTNIGRFYYILEWFWLQKLVGMNWESFFGRLGLPKDKHWPFLL